MRLFGGDRMKSVVERLGVADGEPIESGMITKSIENVQKKVEGRNFSIRKYVLQYDDVMNKQREIIYGERSRVLNGEDLKDYIKNMTGELIEECMGPVVAGSKYPEEWDFNTLNSDLKKICGRFAGFNYKKDDFLNTCILQSIGSDKNSFVLEKYLPP